MRELTIFYEGPNDKDFIENSLKRFLIRAYDNIVPLQLSFERGKTYAPDLIRKMEKRGFEYIVLIDQDDNPCILARKESMRQTIKQDEGNVCVISYELESWIRAGLGKAGCCELGLEYVEDTETYTKESFKCCAERVNSSQIALRRKMEKCFLPKYAIKCNKSFKYFWNKYLHGIAPY